MSKSTFSGVLSGSIWGIIAKIFDSVAKFVTIPMLVAYFGKADYGLIALAFSLNTYLRLMDMGMNVGSTRFFAMWIALGEKEKIANVSRSSIVFYGIIGCINALVFIAIAQFGSDFFNLGTNQIPLFKWILYILSISTVFNWLSNVVTQLLNAHGQQAWVNKWTVLGSLLNFVSAFIAIKLHLSLPAYFVLYTISTLITIPFNIFRLKIYDQSIRKLLSPKWNGRAFKEILGYSVAIFAIGIFQQSADSLRPILLSKYSSKGISVLTEYRVIQTLTMLVIAFGAVFMQVLIPSATKVYTENNREKLDKLVNGGTRYITLFLSLVVFMLAVNSRSILVLYMGHGYEDLSIWLIVWLITVLMSMHNAPVASLALSTGKTKPLVYMSLISCVVSLPITGFLAHKLNVGAAIIGYFFYILLQISFYYFYFIPKILKLSNKALFINAVLPPISAGLLSFVITYACNDLLKISPGILSLIFSSLLFATIYFILIRSFIIKRNEFNVLKTKVLKFK